MKLGSINIFNVNFILTLSICTKLLLLYLGHHALLSFKITLTGIDQYANMWISEYWLKFTWYLVQFQFALMRVQVKGVTSSAPTHPSPFLLRSRVLKNSLFRALMFLRGNKMKLKCHHSQKIRLQTFLRLARSYRNGLIASHIH